MRVKLRVELDAEHGAIKVPAGYLDLRENPSAIEQIEPARRYRPLRGLLAALNGAESVFASVACQTWTKEDPGEAPAAEFGSRTDLIFAGQRHRFDRNSYESLAGQLRELLELEGSTNTVAAEVCVLRCHFHDVGRAGYALRLNLTGQGDTPSQAELRWGLGVAHLQQALLFLSRAVRQQQARAN